MTEKTGDCSWFHSAMKAHKTITNARSIFLLRFASENTFFNRKVACRLVMAFRGFLSIVIG